MWMWYAVAGIFVLLQAGGAIDRARELLNAGRLREAQEALSGTQGPGSDHLQALIRYKEREYVKAAELFERAVTAETKDTAEHRESVLLLGQSYYLANRFDKAAMAAANSAYVPRPNADEGESPDERTLLALAMGVADAVAWAATPPDTRRLPGSSPAATSRSNPAARRAESRPPPRTRPPCRCGKKPPDPARTACSRPDARSR